MSLKRAFFRFYASLNDFLPEEQKQTAFSFAFRGRPAVKDSIEAIGVPHPEVDFIVVDGAPVDFTYQLQGEERVSVYPSFESITVDPEYSLQPDPPATYRFVLDTHLGRLAHYLRMLGFNTWHQHEDAGDAALARLAHEEDRLLLTRDVDLLQRSIVQRGYFVRAVEPEKQLAEVASRFSLGERAAPFTRCMSCNDPLQPAIAEDVRGRVPPQVAESFDRFTTCPSCDRVFWAGSHVDRMRRLINRTLAGDQLP